MRLMAELPKYIVIAVLIGGAVVLIGQLTGTDNSSLVVTVKVPQLSAQAAEGQKLFEANCEACHGQNAGGSDVGPPLVHKVYRTSHHADGAFLLATKRGVNAHHWQFGDMPPQPQVEDKDVFAIVRYVRELQQANGI